ncbi:hypothetical protein OsJ_32065 [Oryza sativa Japonica Group]|uniref:Uncharacterized protein n=1 Tax=Oryza sativa subsp. japonica TaxID=39947 RepID=B9G6H8_ORYSJ|nr:hypothetical protein OsJ_32065 [Oryza sativa Japonica Group]
MDRIKRKNVEPSASVAAAASNAAPDNDGGDTDQIEDADAEMPELPPSKRIIATAADVNSLILSNYAQLLYQFDKDLDRAEDYFKQAVAAEPVDGEAMRRYALFMWHARGDLAGAEDMFTRAIDEEPQSSPAPQQLRLVPLDDRRRRDLPHRLRATTQNDKPYASARNTRRRRRHDMIEHLSPAGARRRAGHVDDGAAST